MGHFKISHGNSYRKMAGLEYYICKKRVESGRYVIPLKTEETIFFNSFMAGKWVWNNSNHDMSAMKTLYTFKDYFDMIISMNYCKFWKYIEYKRSSN